MQVIFENLCSLILDKSMMMSGSAVPQRERDREREMTLLPRLLHASVLLGVCVCEYVCVFVCNSP